MSDLRLHARLTVGTLHLDLDVDVDQGPLVLIGPNGAGKSTVLRALAGGPVTVEGQLLVGGTDIHRLPPERRGVGYVPQDTLLFPNLTALGNVTYGMSSHPDREARALALLEQLGVRDCAHRAPRTLSGGEAQRVAIARALAPSPTLLLLDEPTSALDITARAALRSVLSGELCAPGRTGVVSTHDLRDAHAWGGTLAVVRNGSVRKVSEVPDDPFVRAFLAPL